MTPLEELWEELQEGRIWECSLRDPSNLVVMDGVQMGENIYIDPRPQILEIVLHELLHRRYRRWSEKRVSKEAKNIVIHMTEAEKIRWWKSYNKIKKRGRPLDVDSKEG